MKLKPCPFCGSLELRGPCFQEYIGDTRYPSWWIECEKCPCYLEVEGEESDNLIKHWNTRIKE